jgi:SAM-dependent methyltransferase
MRGVIPLPTPSQAALDRAQPVVFQMPRQAQLKSLELERYSVSESTTEHFLNVTEIAGEEISREQLERLCHRYYWASEYCEARDVLEVAVGSGPGLRYLAGKARSVKAGDYSPEVLARARKHIGDDIELKVFDAQQMPYPDQSFDVVLLFEALYYIPSAARFVAEAHRVLRPGGHLLITTANKDLYDFNPSPFSTAYHGVVELRDLLRADGFEPLFFGYLRSSDVSLRQRLLRPVKAAAVRLNLMPTTMAGKTLLKRLVFGAMVQMPDSVSTGMIEYVPPASISADVPDRVHKVIYCAGKRT